MPAAGSEYGVIIPAYNAEAWLGEAIESVLNQTRPCSELDVVDDGSTDTTRNVVTTFGEAVRLVAQPNGGVSSARNLGASTTTASVLAFLDADDIWEPNKMAKQMELFDISNQIVMAHCGVTYVDAGNQEMSTDNDGKSGDVYKRLLLSEPTILGGGSGIVVRREVFVEVGGFDTRLSTSADWRFFMQVARLGSVGFSEDLLLRYRFHTSNMHYDIDAERRDRLLIHREHAQEGVLPKRIQRLARARSYRTLGIRYLANRRFVRGFRYLIGAVLLEPSCALHLVSSYWSKLVSSRQAR